MSFSSGTVSLDNIATFNTWQVEHISRAKAAKLQLGRTYLFIYQFLNLSIQLLIPPIPYLYIYLDINPSVHLPTWLLSILSIWVYMGLSRSFYVLNIFLSFYLASDVYCTVSVSYCIKPATVWTTKSQLNLWHSVIRLALKFHRCACDLNRKWRAGCPSHLVRRSPLTDFHGPKDFSERPNI